jgi:hypothetical protein
MHGLCQKRIVAICHEFRGKKREKKQDYLSCVKKRQLTHITDKPLGTTSKQAFEGSLK